MQAGPRGRRQGPTAPPQTTHNYTSRSPAPPHPHARNSSRVASARRPWRACRRRVSSLPSSATASHSPLGLSFSAPLSQVPARPIFRTAPRLCPWFHLVGPEQSSLRWLFLAGSRRLAYQATRTLCNLVDILFNRR